MIWLGLLYFCYISPCLSESIRIPPPPSPPPCTPLVPTKHNCINYSCTCGWCPPNSESQNKKDHDPTGNCFIYSNHPAYIEKNCGSVNSTVHTHVNSKYCRVTDIIMMTLFGIWFAVIVITCIIGCSLMGLFAICMCYRESRGLNPHDITLSNLWEL